MKITIPSRLSDPELISEIGRCARSEQGATAELVAHLAEFDARRLHLGAGYSSLFVYCRQVLGLSEHGTYNRIEAARAARRFPIILEGLANGSLNLTTVRLLAPHLTGDNHGDVLRAAARRSKHEVEELVARLSPRPDTPSSVRKVPERRPTPPAPLGPAPHAPSSIGPATSSLVETPPRSVHRPLVAPLAPDRYEIRFTASAATRDKLKLAQDLLRHAVPNGDPAEIFDRALSALLGELSRKKLAAVRKPQPSRAEPRRARGMCRPRSSVSCGRGTEGAVRSSERAATAARNGPSWNTTTSRPTASAAKRPSPTSSFDAARTTAMRRTCSTALTERAVEPAS